MILVEVKHLSTQAQGAMAIQGKHAMRSSLLIAALLLVASPSAFAEVVDIHWSANGGFAHRGSIAAGKMLEVCGKLPADVKTLGF